jgi:hypothetical protein
LVLNILSGIRPGIVNEEIIIDIGTGHVLFKKVKVNVKSPGWTFKA